MCVRVSGMMCALGAISWLEEKFLGIDFVSGNSGFDRCADEVRL